VATRRTAASAAECAPSAATSRSPTSSADHGYATDFSIWGLGPQRGAGRSPAEEKMAVLTPK
jgi:hypothetical protein